jgi:hypothetical protein
MQQAVQGREEPVTDWERVIRATVHVNSEVTDSVDRGLLRYQGRPFVLSGIDRTSLLLTHMLCERGGCLVLNYPVPYFRALAILALEAMYAHPSRNERPYVICITRDPWHREEYMNLQLGDYITPIHKMSFPLGMMRADGSIRDLSNSGRPHLADRPHLVFSHSTRLPRELSNATSTIIAEVDYRFAPEDIGRLEGWSMEGRIPSTLLVVTDPLSRAAKEIYSRNYPTWSWDRGALRSTVGLCPSSTGAALPYPFSVPDVWTKSVAEGQEYLIVPVTDEKVGPRLNEARKYALELRATSFRDESPELLDIANSSLGALHALEDLPVPASFYDIEAFSVWGAVPIRNRLESLSRLATSLRGTNPHAAGFVSGIASKLNDAYEKMSADHSGKPAVVLDVIALAKRKGQPLGIAVKNRASKQALELFLAKKGYGEAEMARLGIRVLTPRDLESPSFSGTLMFTYVPRYMNRHLVLYPCSNKIAFIIYPGERPGLDYMLRKELTDIDQMARQERRVDVLGRIGGLTSRKLKPLLSGSRGAITQLRKITYLEEQEATVTEMETNPLLEGIVGNELVMPDPVDIDAYIPISDDDSSGDGGTDALAIHFDSGKTLLVRPGSYVTIFKASTLKVSDMPARALGPGSYVVLVNESITRGLLDIILERVHRHPKMTYVVVYQRIWIEALRRGMSHHGDTPESLLEKLKGNGSGIGAPLTVRLWQRGLTIGPADPEDIRRIGLIYGEPTLVEHAEDINSAVERVRKIHRQLARRLRFLVKRAGVSLEATGDEDLMVDEELGLYLEDFSDSVRVEEVTSIDGPYEVDGIMLNKVYEGDVWRKRKKLS